VSERLTIGGEKNHGGTVESIGLKERSLKERLVDVGGGLGDCDRGDGCVEGGRRN